MKTSTQHITTSLFDLFKVGPGPSSSHTIGPMKAAYNFLQELKKLPDTTVAINATLEVTLYGSLSATGKGHGTDRAIVAGLLGWLPEECNPEKFSHLVSSEKDNYAISVPGCKPILFSAKNIHFERGRFDFPHPNTLIIRLINENGNVILEHEYYSIGGGFIIRKGEQQQKSDVIPPYPYSTMKELKNHLQKNSLSLTELVIENEIAISHLTKEEVYKKMENILQFMHNAVERGLHTEGVLPGSIQLHRKAPSLFQKAEAFSQSSQQEKPQAQNQAQNQDSFLIFLNAYCEAASEENAAGNIVVTAPTSGASGVIPGITYLLKHHYHYDTKKICEGMFVAAVIGFLVKHNASISGAEMGCMGEIGTASAMGAAMLAHCAGHSVDVIEAAAEIAIEHHLGMTCDPIGGYVQIPCIERNAMGAVKAYNAYLLASLGNHAYQKISLDNVIKVMKATGDDMSKKYKETSEAGLALSSTEC